MPYDAVTGAGSVGVEFAGMAVTSGGGEGSITSVNKKKSGRLVDINEELQWNEEHYRGYHELQTSGEEVVARYYGFDLFDTGSPTVRTRNPFETSLANVTVKAGANRLQRAVVGGSVESGALTNGILKQTNLTLDTVMGTWNVTAFEGHRLCERFVLSSRRQCSCVRKQDAPVRSFSTTLGARFTGPLRDDDPRPPKNRLETLQRVFDEDERSRVVYLTILPPFALASDVEQLFHDYGFHEYDKIEGVMFQHGVIGRNSFRAEALLPTAQVAMKAAKDLDGVPLFDRRIMVKPMNPGTRLWWGRIISADLSLGWHRSSICDLHNVRSRGPLCAPLSDPFMGIKERRSRCVEGFPTGTGIKSY
ncbi:hypothetical protein K458DRAFT_410651 [Lentithecium fluviatile CBS 122367]|uniref:RRM domain-containing protein n=1 Tax=Lentithecium fluviatile CBS 122367 TaxID=1168545 RepID=A0A6G1IDG7_9PLEO|nr:hypothetical protein K458DRAFT_410651 [Lentithecium fluviatile CBS 122367]